MSITIDEYNKLQSGRGSLDFAKLAARRHETIGRIREVWPHSYYRVGDYVFVEEYGDGRATIEMPMTPAQIEYERSKGSGLRTTLTIIGVPMRYVEIIPEWVIRGAVS